MEKTTKHPPTLPPLKTLFTDSWAMFKGSLLNLFIINVIAFGAYIGLLVLGLLLALPFGLISIISAIGRPDFYSVLISSLGGLGFVLVLFIIGFIIVSYVTQAASILIVGNYKKKPLIRATIKHSWKLILPLFLAGVLMSFITSGGYFLFIIPGILLQVFFTFMMYEIILSKKGVLEAFRHSMGIVSAHFWGVFGRVLLWLCIVLAISILPNVVMGENAGGLSFIFSILNILVGWYGISYEITLYNQARHGEEHATKKLLWPVLVAILGWVVAILLVMALASVIPAIIESMSQQSKTPAPVKIMQSTSSY